MNKKALLACLLAVMMLASSCSLIVKDKEVDAATEIIRVGDTVYTKAQVQAEVDDYLAYERDYYANYYGYTIDITDKSVIEEAQSQVIDSLIEQAVLKQMAAQYGADQLTEEEEAEAQEEWDTYYNMFYNSFSSGEEDEDTEAIDAQVRSVLASYGATEESIRTNIITTKLKNLATADVTVSEEEVQADFDSKVASEKASYESNLSAYGSAVNAGTTVYYRPAGYRMVKQILIKFEDADQDVVDGLEDKVDAEQTTIDELTALLDPEQLEALLGQVTVTLSGEEELINRNGAEMGIATVSDLVATAETSFAEDLDEETAANVTALAQAKARQARYQALLDEATETAYANIQDEADRVVAAARLGEDWAALTAEHNDDPGMKEGRATAETGYAVCEGFASFDPAFTAAAMALENVGDISEPTRGSSDGFYIIRYESEVQEGPVDIADVYDSIHSTLLSDKKDSAYEALVQQWIRDANATIDLKALND